MSKRAAYGAEAVAHLSGSLPNPFPRTLGPQAQAYVQEVIESGLTVDMVGRFERAFADALGVAHCIGTPGCTPALAALMSAVEHEPGDEIVVSAITDYGTIQGLCHEHFIPVFADAEPGGPNVSAGTIEPCITDRTRAVLVVHKTGLLCEMDPIAELARQRGLLLVEDCCQAVMGRYNGRLAGTLADVAAFSFDAEKTMGSDVGGCVVTNDGALAERIRFLGQSRGAVQRAGFGREHQEPGHAYRMTQTTAALCLAQLEVVGDHVARRDRLARLLNERLAAVPGIQPLPIPDSTTVWSAWMVGFSLAPGAFDCSADRFAEELVALGLTGAGTGRYYLMPAACTFLQRQAAGQEYPFSIPPASRRYSYGAECCLTAARFLDSFVRWSTFCEKWEPEHCELAARWVAEVADRHRVR